jgi:hypothetical protein
VTIAGPGGSVSDGFWRPYFWISSWSDWREKPRSKDGRLKRPFSIAVLRSTLVAAKTRVSPSMDSCPLTR